MDGFTIPPQTNTATPYAAVPIYFLHSVTQPFCSLSGCWCRSCELEVRALLEAMAKGELLMQDAAPLVESQRV